MILAPVVRIGQYKLSFTMLSLYSFEASTGYQMSAVDGDLTILRAMLRACLLPNHPDITELQAGAAFAAAELPYVFAEITALINASLPKPRSSPEPEARPNPADDWHRLWAIGRYSLHLTEQEFWGCTPLMWDALVRVANAANGAPEEELTIEERSARILRKVEMINAAWGGVDLRKG